MDPVLINLQLTLNKIKGMKTLLKYRHGSYLIKMKLKRTVGAGRLRRLEEKHYGITSFILTKELQVAELEVEYILQSINISELTTTLYRS